MDIECDVCGEVFGEVEGEIKDRCPDCAKAARLDAILAKSKEKWGW